MDLCCFCPPEIQSLFFFLSRQHPGFTPEALALSLTQGVGTQDLGLAELSTAALWWQAKVEHMNPVNPPDETQFQDWSELLGRESLFALRRGGCRSAVERGGVGGITGIVVAVTYMELKTGEPLSPDDVWCA